MASTALPEYPAVTPEQYAEAIATLAEHAFQDHGGAFPSAMVLLSTYNGNNWHIDLTQLCRLDEANYRAALTVIHGRAQLMIEPHQMLQNGDRLFRQIAEQWACAKAT